MKLSQRILEYLHRKNGELIALHGDARLVRHLNGATNSAAARATTVPTTRGGFAEASEQSQLTAIQTALPLLMGKRLQAFNTGPDHAALKAVGS